LYGDLLHLLFTF